MKKGKLLSLFFILFFSILLVSCSKNVLRKEISDSSKFTESEISEAINIAEKEFNKTKDKGTTLKKVVYDENKSNEILDEYSVTLKENYTPLNLENFIVILLDFKTGKDTGALNPNQTYTDFQNIMIKQKETWKIIDGGY